MVKYLWDKIVYVLYFVCVILFIWILYVIMWCVVYVFLIDFLVGLRYKILYEYIIFFDMYWNMIEKYFFFYIRCIILMVLCFRRNGVW